MLSYPYWFFFELCAPLIEFFGFICFVFFAIFGLLDWSFFFTYFLFIVCFGYLYSCFAILMEVLTFNQYKRRIDILRLMLTGLTEPFLYHPFVVWSAIKGFKDLIIKKKGWGEMTRQGLTQQVQPVATSTITITAKPEAGYLPPTPKNELSVLERVIVPGIAKVVSFISSSFKYYLGHASVLLLLMFFARFFEIGYDYSQHGAPAFLGKVILFGMAKDLALFLKIAMAGFGLFSLFYLIHKKLAHVTFIVIALILLLVQVSLSQYFVRTLVPLGADLWAYSMADIKQTVGASGGIQVSMILVFIALISLAIAAFVFLPKRIKIRGVFAFALFIVFAIAASSDYLSATDNWLPGQEYSNNLSINKSDYFFGRSYRHFFPASAETDIYTDNGNSAEDDTNTTIKSFEYSDEKNYPFLHSVDTAVDVLSPFFTKNTTPPNIVILLVEGLGRAFTNEGAYLGNFTPFIDSLSQKSLYWENFLSEGGRTFAVLPSLLSSLPFAKNGFNELGDAMPKHLSLLNILKKNGYNTSFYYGGDAHFDNMDLFMQKNNTNVINDQKTFPAGYTKMPVNNGFTWGYGDKELFRRFLETPTSQPYLDVALTVSTHNPFLINEQEKYLQRFETRMTEIGLSEGVKTQRRNYKYQFASILFTDDAVKNFINRYKQRPDFNNTVFLITGDHRMPEIPMSSKIDRYHVPLIVYSPLLKRTAKFSSISTHFDITPSLLAWLKNSYGLQSPASASWMGSGLDTARQFRNIHSYPIMQTKNDLIDFISGNFLLNGEDLFRINPNMDLTIEQDAGKTSQMKAGFNRFLAKNKQFISNPASIVPDSLLVRYTNK